MLVKLPLLSLTIYIVSLFHVFCILIPDFEALLIFIMYITV